MDTPLSTELRTLAEKHKDCLILHSFVGGGDTPQGSTTMGHALHADDEINETNVIKRVSLLIGAKLAYEIAVQNAADWMRVSVPALKAQIENGERAGRMRNKDF
jgi:hypothetical protein